MKRLLLGLVAFGGLALSAGTLRDYVAAFNAEDEELYTNAVCNAQAADFAKRAADLERSIQERLWNMRRNFFTTLDNDGKLDDVCELHGYAPFYFRMPRPA